VASAPLPDPSQFDKKSEYYDPKASPDKPIWMMVEVEYVKKIPLIPLDELRQDKNLKNMMLLRPGSRLSITPVDEKDWKHIQKKWRLS
jgi:predicted RNA-binding protein with PUA-like domain